MGDFALFAMFCYVLLCFAMFAFVGNVWRHVGGVSWRILEGLGESKLEILTTGCFPGHFVQNKYANNLIVVKTKFGKQILTPKIVVFLRFFLQNFDLESSGRSVGKIPTKWHLPKLPWLDFMAKKPKKLTSI